MAHVAAPATSDSLPLLVEVCKNGALLICVAGGAAAGIKSVCLIAALHGGTATVGILASVAMISFVALAIICARCYRQLQSASDTLETCKEARSYCFNVYEQTKISFIRGRLIYNRVAFVIQRFEDIELLSRYFCKLTRRVAKTRERSTVMVARRSTIQTLEGHVNRTLASTYYHTLKRYTTKAKNSARNTTMADYMDRTTARLVLNRYLTTWKMFRMKRHFSKRFNRLANIAEGHANQTLLSKYYHTFKHHVTTNKQLTAAT